MERDVIVLLKTYLKSDFIVDAIANVPLILFLVGQGYPHDPDEVEESKRDGLFVFCLALRTLRLAHMYKVKHSLTRLVDKLSEYFSWKRYVLGNVLHWSATTYKFLACCHYLACGWILLHE